MRSYSFDILLGSDVNNFAFQAVKNPHLRRHPHSGSHKGYPPRGFLHLMVSRQPDN